MSTPLTALPNDGSVMRWAIEHGQKHLRSLADIRTFANKLQIFRESRENNADYIDQMCDIKIDGHNGVIEMYQTSDYYGFGIRMDNLRITEAYLKISAGFEGESIILHITAPGVVPASVSDTYAGGPVAALIQLPEALETIIKGRTINDIEQYGDNIIIRVAGEK